MYAIGWCRHDVKMGRPQREPALDFCNFFYSQCFTTTQLDSNIYRQKSCRIIQSYLSTASRWLRAPNMTKPPTSRWTSTIRHCISKVIEQQSMWVYISRISMVFSNSNIQHMLCYAMLCYLALGMRWWHYTNRRQDTLIILLQPAHTSRILYTPMINTQYPAPSPQNKMSMVTISSSEMISINPSVIVCQ